MEEFFGIDYTFGKNNVQKQLNAMLLSRKKGYVCVADGVTLAMSYKNEDLREVLSHAAITVCDSGWVPVYLHWLYHIHREQYSGSDLMMDLVRAKKYTMMFVGASPEILQALQARLSAIDERINSTTFLPLPFSDVAGFNYPEIAGKINAENPDLVFVSLGMPKQEFFMYRLTPYIDRAILAGVGAAFKFNSGLSGQSRAPQWMISAKLEWLFRLFSEPKKQIERCTLIIFSLPFIFLKEYRRKNKGYDA